MRKSLITLFLCAAIIISGCQSNSIPETELSESANNTDISNQDTSAGESQETVSESAENEPLTVDDIPSPVIKEHSALPDTETVEYSDFVGIPLSENPEESSALNSKSYGFNPICFDTDNVYFSNPKDRQSLYVYDGKASKCLVKLPVNTLNYYDYKIYFISSGKTVNPDDSIDCEGFLYMYDLKTAELTRLTDFYISDPLYVSSKGIFYERADDINGKCTVYKLDEASGEITPMYNSYKILNYNGFHYNMITEYDEVSDIYTAHLCLSGDESSYSLITSSDEISFPTCECIANGKFYYKQQGNNSLTSIDLKDGTVFKYPVSSEYGLGDYTFFDGTEYMLFGDGLYEFRDGRFIKYHNFNSKASIVRIYSGPNGIYALTRVNTSSYDLAEIALSYDNEFDEYIVEFNSIT